jgi:hypothetical protein
MRAINRRPGYRSAYGETTKWASEASEYTYRFHERDGVEAPNSDQRR